MCTTLLRRVYWEGHLLSLLIFQEGVWIHLLMGVSNHPSLCFCIHWQMKLETRCRTISSDTCPHKSKKLVYMLYCESKRSINETFSTMSHFDQARKTLAPQIKCRKSHTFAICDIFISLRDRLMHIAKTTSRDREREELLNGFRSHLNNVKLERSVYNRNRLKAIERLGEVLSRIIDGANQSKFSIARFLDKSKSESGHSMKQKTHRSFVSQRSREGWVFGVF